MKTQHEHKYEQLLEEAKKLELDAESCCLLKVVALFASDGSNLKGRAQVERIQDDFCLLLYRFPSPSSLYFLLSFNKNTFSVCVEIFCRFLVDRDGHKKASGR